MTRNVYDARHAKALVPLLRSITNEMQEREQAIARLEQWLEERAGASDDGEPIGTSRAETSLVETSRADISRAEEARSRAELSIQRRELRFATRELERLGCALDQDHPLRVLIPGNDGKLDRGFVWSPSDETVHAG